MKLSKPSCSPLPQGSWNPLGVTLSHPVVPLSLGLVGGQPGFWPQLCWVTVKFCPLGAPIFQMYQDSVTTTPAPDPGTHSTRSGYRTQSQTDVGQNPSLASTVRGALDMSPISWVMFPHLLLKFCSFQISGQAIQARSYFGGGGAILEIEPRVLLH